jgi:hypothetical protein
VTRRPLLTVGLVFLSAFGCTGGGDDAATGPPSCRPELTVPDGFAAVETFEQDQPGNADVEAHVGVRLSLRDHDGRDVLMAAGIPGEWGEGMSPAGEVSLAEGRTVALLTANRNDTWLARWDEGDRCDPRVLIGNGYSRQEFIELLARAGQFDPTGSPTPAPTR